MVEAWKPLTPWVYRGRISPSQWGDGTMAIGRSKKHRQRQPWVQARALAKALGHPFYERLAKIFEKHGFDSFVNEQSTAFYAEKMGRPPLPLAVDSRLLLTASFEGIGSERGIARRLADSISLRSLFGGVIAIPRGLKPCARRPDSVSSRQSGMLGHYL